MPEGDFAGHIRHLEVRIKLLNIFCTALAVGLVLAVWHGTTRTVTAAHSQDVIRARGLIIEDAQGRARILIGAPFPSVPDRLRQDSTATSLMFLDDQGHDRISIGQVIPAQINGKVSSQFHRIGNAYGLTIYDSVGNERGGMGFLTNGGSLNRAAVVLDRAGGDAIGMDVDDKSDSANLILMYSPKVAPYTTGLILGTQGGKASIVMKDLHDVPRASFSIGSDLLPSFRVFSKDGKPGPELLGVTTTSAN